MLRLGGTSPARVRSRGRKTRPQVFFATLAAVLLGAWAPKPPHVDIKSVGIIAAVGDTCMFEHIRNARFEWIGSPEASFLEISDWGIDDTVAKAVTAALSPRYRVQLIAIEHQDFNTWTYNSLARRIRELPMPEIPVDAYLLILRDWRGDEIGNSDHQLAGLGVYRRDLLHGARNGVFASYRLVLMEPDQGRIVASRAALLPNGHLPCLPVSSALWAPTQNDLSAGQKRKLQADFLALIDETLPDTLGRIGLSR
jgi:hypothetical protein